MLNDITFLFIHVMIFLPQQKHNKETTEKTNKKRFMFAFACLDVICGLFVVVIRYLYN